jgi:hypothetical protein
LITASAHMKFNITNMVQFAKDHFLYKAKVSQFFYKEILLAILRIFTILLVNYINFNLKKSLIMLGK